MEINVKIYNSNIEFTDGETYCTIYTDATNLAYYIDEIADVDDAIEECRADITEELTAKFAIATAEEIKQAVDTAMISLNLKIAQWHK